MFCTGLEVKVGIYLGVTKEERANLQYIDIRFEFRNTGVQECMVDDNANDYVCYQKVAQSIFNKFHKKEVRLLEYICCEVYKLIKLHLPVGAKINVCVQKQCKNIVEGQDAKATCRYTEFVGSI